MQHIKQRPRQPLQDCTKHLGASYGLARTSFVTMAGRSALSVAGLQTAENENVETEKDEAVTQAISRFASVRIYTEIPPVIRFIE